MLQIIKKLLQQIIDDIDSNNSNISEKQQFEVIQFIQKINTKELSKLEAAEYLGVSRATFDNYIRNGWIAQGRKSKGFKEIYWNRTDMDKLLIVHLLLIALLIFGYSIYYKNVKINKKSITTDN